MSINQTHHRHEPPTRYAICIKEQMDEKWVMWFGGLQSETTPQGNTTFIANVADDAALYGLLRKIRDSGLTLVSINRLGSETSS